MSAEEVRRRSFASAFRGFDQAEVRSFLDRVADELAAAERTERDLREELRQARDRLLHPRLDETTLTAALGEEAARILQSAHEASSDLRRKVEESVARMVGDAQEQAETIRRAADSILAERTAEAEAAAAAVRNSAEVAAAELVNRARRRAETALGEARSASEAMSDEAEQLKVRLLGELTQRRRVMNAQVEQLAAGRESILRAVQTVRHFLDEVIGTLDSAEGDARRAAAEALQRALAENELDTDHMEHEIGPSLTAPLALLAEVTADLGRSLELLEAEQLVRPPAHAAEPPTVAPVDVAPVDVAPVDVDDEATPADAPALADAPVTPAPPGGGAEFSALTGSDSADPEAQSSAHPRPAIVIVDSDVGDEDATLAGLFAAAEDAPRPSVDLLPPPPPPAAPEVPAVAPEPPTVRETSFDRPLAPIRRYRETDSDYEPLESVRIIRSEPAPAAPPPPPPPPPAASVTPEPPEPEVEEEPLPTPPPAPEPEPEPQPEPEPEPAAPAKVDELFARLRAEREVARADAEAVLAAHDQAAPGDVAVEPAASPEPARPEPAAADVRPADEDAEPEPPVDEDIVAGGLIDARNQALVPVHERLARRLKRTLQDDQNNLLDGVRGDGRGRRASLPERSEHELLYVKAVSGLMDDAYAAGRDFAGARFNGSAGVSTNGSGSPGAPFAAALAADLVQQLRSRLEPHFGPSADDGELAEATNAAFRMWKGERVESFAMDYAVAAFQAGVIGAVVPGTVLRWIVDDDGGPCPDCDDNGLADTAAGQPFPTGQPHPPAHPGCRCLLAPVTA